jgi:hypothetical protein
MARAKQRFENKAGPRADAAASLDGSGANR